MNAKTSGRPLMRAGICAATLLGTALLTAACGGGSHTPPSAGAPTASKSRYQMAVDYAHCMRSHGDASWPDPNSNGMFGNNNGSLDESSNAYKTANQACSYLAAGSNAPSQTQENHALAKLLTYSKCMRAHGVPKFPDPTVDSSGVSFSFSGDIGQHTPQFPAAQQACQSLMPRQR